MEFLKEILVRVFSTIIIIIIIALVIYFGFSFLKNQTIEYLRVLI